MLHNPDWWLFVGLTAVGALGLTCHEIAAFCGFSARHVEVPFATFVSLAEHVAGIALGWYWFGGFEALKLFLIGSLAAFALTLLSRGRYQPLWFLGQGFLLALSGGMLASFIT